MNPYLIQNKYFKSKKQRKELYKFISKLSIHYIKKVKIKLASKQVISSKAGLGVTETFSSWLNNINEVLSQNSLWIRKTVGALGTDTGAVYFEREKGKGISRINKREK